MGNSTVIQSTTGLVREPQVSALDMNSIKDFVERIKKLSLTDTELQAIHQLFTTHEYLHELCRLHKLFLDAKSNFNLLAGLDPQQTLELHELIGAVKSFKELRKNGTVKNEDYKNFMVNEKKLIAFNQIIDWWTINCDKLKKLELWESIGVMITNEAKKNHESDDVIKTRLHKLTDIKSEWINHQFFARYSSSQLQTFYEKYLFSIERWINDYLNKRDKNEEKTAPIIKEYLTYLIYQLQILKKHAIHSMLARLQCAEQQGEIRFDDLLIQLTEQIEKDCNVLITKPNKKLTTRRSLTPALINSFCHHIDDYCKMQPEETTIAKKFSQLKFRVLPPNWKSLSNDPQVDNELLLDPILVYSENILPSLLDKITSNPNLPTEIIETSIIYDDDFILRKLRQLVSDNPAQTPKDKKAKLKPADIAREKILNAQVKKYTTCVNEISNLVDNLIQKNIKLLLDAIFSINELSSDALNQFLVKIDNVIYFNKEFLLLDYSFHCDIILALGNKLRSMVAKYEDVSPLHIKNIQHILAAKSPNLKITDFESLKGPLAKLSDIAQKLNEESSGEFLHLIVNFLESPSLEKTQLATALARHRHIASLHNEKWDDSFKINTGDSPEQLYIQLICSYIKNVLLNIIQSSPYIDLNNFNANEMCQTLADLEADSHKNAQLIPPQIIEIQHDFQRKILFKLNDLFLIKNYLYVQSENKIHLERLEDLINRTNQFFTNENYKNAMLESISKAVRALLKSYCLVILQQDLSLDQTYIQQLNELLHDNLLLKLHGDEELDKTLKIYIETYNGAKNNIASLVVSLLPAEAHCEPLIYSYAKARLTYLKSSRDVNSADYQFFNHYYSLPSVAALINETKQHFKNLTELASSNRMSWSPGLAYIIEAFGSNTTVTAYRLKRVIEFLEQSHYAKMAQDEVEILFPKFIATINPTRLINQQILNPATIVKDQLTLQQYFDYYIANQPWSLLLENIISRAGTHAQLQQLHFKFTLYLIQTGIECTSTWLGKKILTQTEDMKAIDELSDSNDNKMEKSFYLGFYGEENCRQLCNVLEQHLNKLEKANSDFNTKELSKEEYKKLITLIVSIRAFARFYQLFGNNPALTVVYSNIGMLENKLSLHYKLHTVLKRQTSLLSISSENTTLHNLILAIIDTVRKLEDKQILSETNINDYLTFFDSEVLAKLEVILAQTSSSFSFKVLYYLANLILYLASEKMKLLLLDANKNQLSTNPHWLSLINHLDEGSTIRRVEAIMHQSTPTIAFQQVLLFGKRLTNIKHQTHQLIHKSLFLEAGITLLPEMENVKLGTLLATVQLKDSQYLKLWQTCAAKLQTNQIDSQCNINYIDFLIKFLTRISNQILIRARDNSTLLNDYIALFSNAYEIKNRVIAIAKEDSKISSPRAPAKFFKSPADFEKSLQPLFIHIDRALALQLIHRLDSFAAKLVPKKSKDVFRKLCDDSTPLATANGLLARSDLLKSLLKIHDDKDALKLASILTLYNSFNLAYNSGLHTLQLQERIDQVHSEATGCTKLKTSKSYTTFMLELRQFAVKYFSLQEDRSALFKHEVKKHSHV